MFKPSQLTGRHKSRNWAVLNRMAAAPLRMIAVCVCLTAASAGKAEAVTLTTSFGTYEITAVRGTYNSLESQLLAQDWHGNRDFAFEISTALGSQLGTPNFLPKVGSPYFVYEGPNTGGNFISCKLITTIRGQSCNPTAQGNVTGVFAIGTAVPVPLPAAFGLALAGFGLLGALGFRRRQPA